MTSDDARENPVDDDGCTDLCLLTSMVCHHLINTYAATVSFLELLALEGTHPTLARDAEWSQAIITSALNASTVARRLSDAASELRPLHHAPLPLHELVQGAVDSYRARHASPCQWSVATDDLWLAQGDAGLLSMMLARLFDNATEAALDPARPRRSEPPRIDVALVKQPGDWILLSVRNSGGFLSDAVRERAFEPFFTTKAGHKGIGLTVAKAVWRRHQGSLRFVCEPAGGATVELRVYAPQPTPAATTPQNGAPAI
jgi:signal transduction histidine kinase